MPTEQEQGGTERPQLPGRHILIETLDELQDHSGAIFGRLNADKRLALLAFADPVGVLSDLGYELSREAARALTHRIPRMSRLARDNYLRWLRGLERIPETIDIKFRRRPSGSELLQPPPESQTLNQADPPGETADFDIVLQFAEGFCERLIQRHHADGRLPRSVYVIAGKLHYFLHSGGFEQSKPSLGDPEQEIHFAKPALDFLIDKPTRVRIASPFQASGFDVKSLKGVAIIKGELVAAKDAKGHPLYIDVSFDNLQAGDVQVQMVTAGVAAASVAKIKTLIRTVYRDFRKLDPFLAHPTPITFTLVDSGVLAAHGVTPQPGEVEVAVRKPTGATAPLLIVGYNRAERKGGGNLDAIACAIQPGGDFAVIQGTAWPQQGLNEGQSAILPKRFDPDTGQLDPNGDLRIDSVVWQYRDGGLTGKVAGEHANALLWFDVDVDGEAYIDITFHASDPELTIVGSSDLEHAACWEKLFVVLFFAALGAFIGGVIGGVIGGAAGAALGALIGGLAGLVGGYYLVGWQIVTFDKSGLPPSAPSKTQTIKLTHTRSIPEIWGLVKVVPNDFKLTGTAVSLSASVIGPATEEVEPYITVAGSFSADFELPAAPQQPQPMPLPQSTPAAQQLAAAIQPYVLGSIKLFYSVVDTCGLQGTLSYLWTFNGNPIGTQKMIAVEVPVTGDMLTNFQFNKVNVLGVLHVAVEDSFGRRATWTGTISVGREQDLRAFRQPLIKQPEFIDPMTRWRELERLPAGPGPLAQVGWMIGGQIAPGGTLVSQLAFTAHGAAEPMVLVCTTPL